MACTTSSSRTGPCAARAGSSTSTTPPPSSGCCRRAGESARRRCCCSAASACAGAREPPGLFHRDRARHARRVHVADVLVGAGLVELQLEGVALLHPAVGTGGEGADRAGLLVHVVRDGIAGWEGWACFSVR